MTDAQAKIALGGLLHDIGKVIYRQGDDHRKHSQSGYDFLRNELKFGDDYKEILDVVRYHHADMLKNAGIPKDSPAYIIYIANNIASAVDRRKNNFEDTGFEISMPLWSIFNILNGNRQELCYEPGTLDTQGKINFPSKEKKKFDEHFYKEIKDWLQNNFKEPNLGQEYINSLLEALEMNLSFVPSSTAKDEMADISLYDHIKLTAAIASCIFEYLQEKGITDYRDRLFLNARDFYVEKAFLLYSMDISGIQDFIYTITSKNALKTLRARSFYLEIMMEHIIACLLEALCLSKANLIYSGGGHCYLLIPNTDRAKKTAEDYQKQLNQWFMDMFQVSLYVVAGYAACSADALKNEPQGSYSEVFRQIGIRISGQKSSRYCASDIRNLNALEHDSYTRECKVCKKIAKTDDDGVCPFCRAIEKFSKNILHDKFFTVTRKKTDDALPLPGECYLMADDKESLKKKMRQDDHFVRTYCKNNIAAEKHVAAKLWIGDYSSGKTFEEYAEQAEGIKRIAILRADVDNLGQAFVSGFENPKNRSCHVTLSRTAALSRQLSLFFKLHMNKIAAESSFSINGKKAHPRNVAICYSGGDDLFIVGSWNEIIELAIDIRRDFEKYTQGTLTLSAGIGIYLSDYPISAIADEVGAMEESAKALPGKNGVTIFEDGQFHAVTDASGKEIFISDGTYSWQEFEQHVLEEKYKVISSFFETSEERGKNFLYHILELIRGKKEKINFARYVYLLSRMEPDKEAAPGQIAAYKDFSAKMYKWVKSEEDCRHLKTAISLYAYMTRDKEEACDGN